MRLFGSLASVAITAIVLAACSGFGGSSAASGGEQRLTSQQIMDMGVSEREAGNDAQADALEDGEVTFDEYSAAFQNLASCLNEAGFTVSQPVMNPVTGNGYSFSSNFGDRERESALRDLDTCETENWVSVSRGYSLSREAVMEEPLRQATAECLRDLGFDATGDEVNVAAFVEIDGVDADSVMECVMSEATRLYPDHPSYSVGF